MCQMNLNFKQMNGIGSKMEYFAQNELQNGNLCLEWILKC